MSQPVTRRQFLQAAGAAAAVAASPFALGQASRPQRLNVLLITADDMNYNSPGFTGCKVDDITPNLDRLAKESLWVVNAHVTAAICMPSRQSLMTGRYPHRNGAAGFDPIDRSVPTLQEQLAKAGYFNGILGKVLHLSPPDKYPWDYKFDAQDLGMGRDPALYHQRVTEFFRQARQAGKPFFLMANSHDPHRPFAGGDEEKMLGEKRGVTYPPARRYYKPEEAEIPGFLPDIPDVRKEVAQYFSSVHRCDETVGQILRALKESGQEDNTLVMFLSDNGMALPFAKTNCYLTSTRTPWLIRWPGKVKPGVDRRHMINGIDFMPTILEAAGMPMVEGMDGRSFVPLLTDGKQDGREQVYTVINTTSARQAFPMRCLQTRQLGYIFNAWSDGTTVFKNESQAGLTFKAMKAAAESDKAVAERVKLFVYRVPEELYDLEKDPSALHNLIDDPAYKTPLRQMRKDMLKVMKDSSDPLLEDFQTKVPAP